MKPAPWQSIANFLFEAGFLAKTPRRGFDLLGAGKQNVAEHTLRVAFIAYALAVQEKRLDREKVLKMALFHDFDEARTGDPTWVNQLYLKRRSGQAIAAASANLPFGREMRALDDLIDEGLVEHIGISNFHIPLLKAAQSYARHKLVNNQIHYNLAARAYEENGTLEYYQKNNILVTAYRPINKGGFLSNSLLVNVARKHNKTPAQIALKWLTIKPNIVTIIKCAQLEHLQEALSVLGWQLEPIEATLLEREFPRGETMHLPQ